MPIYEYKADAEGCSQCSTGFEVLQPASEPPLTRCPECGQTCHRLFSTFATVKSTRDMLSTKNLARHGFTQYKRAGGGHYEKTTGEGPSVIGGN